MIESATFWQESPEIETGELAPDTIGTEVFFLPCASHVEKEGTFTQTQRLLQWRGKAGGPPRGAPHAPLVYLHLGRDPRARLKDPPDPPDQRPPDMTPDYSRHAGAHAPDPGA